MSRIEKQPVVLPEAVEVNIVDAENLFKMKGPKGELSLDLISDISVAIEDGAVKVTSNGKTRFSKAVAGTYRSLIQNMVIGVTEGYIKELELIGVGYRGKSQGKTLNLTLGFSHPINYEIPEGIEISTPSQTEITIAGIDKQKVGQVAAELRAIRPPEPYKGKGVRYKGEHITLKETKKAV
ncbi:MAG TPA: 50S ribosomal protein L6 [SAR86 cluster bacterium]|jgi:large subunit ribosomal protein L6|nr:50S ribosomal protein L6 [Gammaproteobacteria bacterium]HJM15727.1 50S ribosomal protein L6 [SAR86 cluster bacterium]MBQ09575.1 50S ribosomal protein L6 [Gammaproteobacteria bacterium]MDP6146997.1 50S ribosomal protein L6 [Gammaproteobacteria bacterium]HJL79895.1 50S ribosomal protein L6 [Gammaproteobacteria bacterium]|tara:strand:+ start:813 stop:1355 length:543 start_codon:yes stop_codon:yes gene_type:complete